MERPLPVIEHRERILAAVQANQVVLLVGPTGCGKTTQVPQILLDGGGTPAGRIAVSEPRRIAAIAAAHRVAEERASPIGHEVGYHVRFERKLSHTARIKFATYGVLLREATSDPLLSQYACIIVDEAHERDTFSDFLLGYLKRLCEKRPDLRVVIMSATLDHREFLGYFPQATLVNLSTRQFPVETHYLNSPQHDLPETVLRTIQDIHQHGKEGDILVFLPGERSIRQVMDRGDRLRNDRIVFVPLFGSLPPKEQQRAFASVDGRKVIIATNVAESSVTIPGIRFVIDSGLAKRPGFDALKGAETLDLTKVSRSSARQRAGRAGRTAPGVCIRLYPEEDFIRRPLYEEPEILRSDLTSLLLTMKALGNAEDFPFLTQPQPEQWQQAEQVLQFMGALDEHGALTGYGEQLARIPLEPALAHFVLTASWFSCVDEAVTMAAMLSVGRFFVHDLYDDPEYRVVVERFWDAESDFLTLLAIWDAYHKAQRKDAWCDVNYINQHWMRAVRTIRGHTLEVLRRLGIARNSSRDRTVLGRAILASFAGNALRHHRFGRYCGNGRFDVELSRSSLLTARQPQYVVSYRFHSGASGVFAECNHEVQYAWLQELAPALLSQQERAGEEAPAKTFRMHGVLRIETNGRQRIAHLDVDLARSSGRLIRVVSRKSLVLEERRFPVTLLGFSGETQQALTDEGIAVLATLPNTREGLLACGITDPAIVDEVLDKLERLGYVARTTPAHQKVQLAEPEDRLHEAFLSKPLEVLDLTGKTLMLLWGVELHTVGDLVARTEKELANDIRQYTSGQSKVTGLRLNPQVVIQEVKERLMHFDLRLTPVEDRSRGFFSGRELVVLPPASPADDARAAEVLGDQFSLFKQYREASGDERIELRNVIATKNRFLPWKVANFYWWSWNRRLIEDPMIEPDDLYQEGCLGLMQAIELFDYTRGFRFSTYGYHWIRQCISRALDNSTLLPVHILEKLRKFLKVYRTLKDDLGVEPTREDIATATGKPVEQVERQFALLQMWFHARSLDEPVENGGDEGSSALLDFQEDTAPSPYDVFERAVLESTVENILRASPLQDVDRRCVELYFGLNGHRDHTLEEVGEQLGVTRERIRQRLEKALGTLRTTEVWRQTQPFFPYLKMPSPKTPPKFHTELGESRGSIVQTRRTKLEIAEIMLMDFAIEHGIAVSDLRKPEELPEPLASIRLHAIAMLRQAGIPGNVLRTLFGQEALFGEFLQRQKAEVAVGANSIRARSQEPTPESQTAHITQLALAREMLADVARQHGVSPSELQHRGELVEPLASARADTVALLRAAKVSYVVCVELFGQEVALAEVKRRKKSRRTKQEVQA